MKNGWNFVKLKKNIAYDALERMGERLEPSIDFCESLLAQFLVCEHSHIDFPIDLDHLHRIQFKNTNFKQNNQQIQNIKATNQTL